MLFPSILWEHKSVNSAKSVVFVNTAKASVKSQLIYSWYQLRWYSFFFFQKSWIATKQKGFWLKKNKTNNEKKNLPSDGRHWLLHPKCKSVVLCQWKRFRQNITRWLTERRERTREQKQDKQTKTTKKQR